MSRSNNEHPRVAHRDRHMSRNSPWNAKPMKKSGSGKGNWGVVGSEINDFKISVNQTFEDSDFRDDEIVDTESFNKIRVVSREELE